jgi:acyl carrier protein
MSLTVVCEILRELGVDEVDLSPAWRLRANLALDSTQTADLEAELKERFQVSIDLWDMKDYAVREVAEAIAQKIGDNEDEAREVMKPEKSGKKCEMGLESEWRR